LGALFHRKLNSSPYIYPFATVLQMPAPLAAISMIPISISTRALPHCHAIVSAAVGMDAQTLADELKRQMDAVLQAHSDDLQIPLFASVRVFAINSPQHLERASLYTEKVIPLGLLVGEALSRAGARNADGEFNPAFLKDLEHGLGNLYDQIESISSGLRAYDPALHNVRERLTLGNLRFGRGCILAEPKWHCEYRLQKAKEPAAKRARRKSDQRFDEPDGQAARRGKKKRKQISVRRSRSAECDAPRNPPKPAVSSEK
jgi:hypothetical protein